jgi:hypothetical protein
MKFPTGSKRWRWDPRERKFEHHRFYGAPNTAILPKEGLKRPLRPIENQRFTLRCGAYSAGVSNGYLRRLRFHPDWQAKKIGQKQKRNVDDYGSEPRAIMNSLRDDGSLFWDFSPIHLETHGAKESGDWYSYPDDLDEKAKGYRITGYLGVDGPHDTFDDIKWALFNAYDPVTGTGAVVHAFSQWYDEWTYAPNGIIGLSYGAPIASPSVSWWKKAWNSLKRFFGAATGWHTYLFVDWCIINGVEYLISPGSYGTGVGNQGFFYFPREVINAEFKKWGTALKIPTGMLTEDMIQEAKKETALGLVIRKFLAFCYILSDAYGSSLDARETILARALQAIQEARALLASLSQPTPTPPANNLLNVMALAIQKHEGWATPGTWLNSVFYANGSLSYRCNNPGNARYSSVGYLPKYGVVKEHMTGNEKPGQRGFAVFSSYEVGFMYLKNLILEKARTHPEWNLFDFFGDEKAGWAPKSDGNNYIAYARAVAKQLNVDPKTWELRQLL